MPFVLYYSQQANDPVCHVLSQQHDNKRPPLSPLLQFEHAHKAVKQTSEPQSATTGFRHSLVARQDSHSLKSKMTWLYLCYHLNAARIVSSLGFSECHSVGKSFPPGQAAIERSALFDLPRTLCSLNHQNTGRVNV
jgi:hypothetical protein